MPIGAMYDDIFDESIWDNNIFNQLTPSPTTDAVIFVSPTLTSITFVSPTN